MKHLSEIKSLINLGDSKAAMEALDSLLCLAPKNSEALRLKADILDSWGRFEDSFLILRKMVDVSSLSDESIYFVNKRGLDDRTSLIYSDVTNEGRVFYPFPLKQVVISLLGVLGCIGFLLISPNYMQPNEDNQWAKIGLFFFLLVMLPWFALIVSHLKGIKKIVVGMRGLKIVRGTRVTEIPWNDVGCVIVEHDNDSNKDHLKLQLYRSGPTSSLLEELDISRANSVVKARRHFVHCVISYVGIVLYLDVKSRNRGEMAGIQEIFDSRIPKKHNLNSGLGAHSEEKNSSENRENDDNLSNAG